MRPKRSPYCAGSSPATCVGPGAGSDARATVDSVAVEAEVASTAAGTKAALALATGSVVSGAADIAAGESPTGTSAAGATGELPSELFRIWGAAGRCGGWAHARRGGRGEARGERG